LLQVANSLDGRLNLARANLLMTKRGNRPHGI
jgi:hypothetical protein